ncbi:MAG: OmpH family outer membrane protein [Candidatus Bipolaricaulia bacterium]
MKQTVWIVLIVVALVAGFFGGWLSKGTAAPDTKLADQVSQLQGAVDGLQAQLSGLAKAADLASLKQQVDSLAQKVQTGTTGGGGLKIAYVNAEEVFLKYKGTAAAVQQFSAEKQKKEDELKQLQQQYKSGQISADEYQSKVQQIDQELKQLDLQLTAQVQQKMIAVISEVAQEKGYDWVTRKKDVVLYVRAGLMDDITDLVIQRLNAKLEAEGSSGS